MPDPKDEAHTVAVVAAILFAADQITGAIVEHREVAYVNESYEDSVASARELIRFASTPAVPADA